MNMNVSGIIDGGDSFDGTNDYINCGDNSSLKGMTALTVEIWVKPTAIGASGAGVVAKWTGWSQGSYIMFWGGSGNLGWGVINQAGSSGQISGGPAVAIGQWQHLVGVYDGSQVRLYRNATLAGTPASLTGTVMSEASLCYVGRYTSPYFTGTADEVRISRVARSASWLTTEFNNQASPSTFYTVGSEEQAPSNYTLTVLIVGSGSVNLNATGPYSHGVVVELTAVPTIGWSFDHWSDDLSGSTSPATIVMDNNKIVTATFTQNVYALTTSVVGNGSVSLNDTGPYNYGDIVQLTALPDAGWNFKYWSGGLSGSANPATLAMTSNYSVTAHFGYPKLYVSPPLVEKELGDVGSTFNVDVKLEDVKDMWGFDFKLGWDSNLLALVGVEYNTALNAVWGSDNWLVAADNNGSGFYQLAAVSMSYGFNTTESHTLATLTFRVEDPHSNSPAQTLIHFVTHKLSNSQYQPIDNVAEDGTYRMTEGERPTLNMTPTAKTCRKYNETFTVAITVSAAYNVTDFEFELHYNTTLLNYAGVTWNAWDSGTITVNESSGYITGITSGLAISGAQTLVTIEFNATYYRVWKDENMVSGWKNNQTGTILIQWANLSYTGSPDLDYVRSGSLNQINVGPDFAYTFSPIRGDIDNNGVVDVFDIRSVAYYYDQANATYDLNGDGIIDIFDLVLIASNFGYTYIP